MNTTDAIQEQLKVLRQELKRARSVFKASKIGVKLRDRVAAPFDNAMARLETEIEALEGMVTNGQPLDVCWCKLNKVQREARKVFDECLEFIHGALARKAQLDNGICVLTDDLLDDLAAGSDIAWGRFTVLGTSELYRDIAEIIRIRYPELSLWGIPLAAHEFAHYLGSELRESEDGEHVYPFQVLLKNADENRSGSQDTQEFRHTRQWYHLQEHFADLFATYTLGPAYAAAFILLRMNPIEAEESKWTHPSGAQRVHGILWTLGRMDELTPSDPPFRAVTSFLRSLWQKSLHATHRPDELRDAEESLTNQRMAKLFDLLDRTTPSKLAFGQSNWRRAENLASDLIREDDLIPEAVYQRSPQSLHRRDVLNGAWLARLQCQRPHTLIQVEKTARIVYELIPRIGQL